MQAPPALVQPRHRFTISMNVTWLISWGWWSGFSYLFQKSSRFSFIDKHVGCLMGSQSLTSCLFSLRDRESHCCSWNGVWAQGDSSREAQHIHVWVHCGAFWCGSIPHAHGGWSAGDRHLVWQELWPWYGPDPDRGLAPRGGTGLHGQQQPCCKGPGASLLCGQYCRLDTRPGWVRQDMGRQRVLVPFQIATQSDLCVPLLDSGLIAFQSCFPFILWAPSIVANCRGTGSLMWKCGIFAGQTNIYLFPHPFLAWCGSFIYIVFCLTVASGSLFYIVVSFILKHRSVLFLVFAVPMLQQGQHLYQFYLFSFPVTTAISCQCWGSFCRALKH